MPEGKETHSPGAASALDDQLREGIARVKRAELLVGIPSFRNAATIGHVARTAARGLIEHFSNARVVLVNADGGSEDGTRERVADEGRDVPVITGKYVGPPGKGSAFRAIFETAVALDVRACAVVDSDLRSITPEWIARLLGPVVRAEADYVTPMYARHKHDGTITNSVAYPLTRALYGLRIRQPIGGEFGFHADLARAYLAEPVWDGDVARFGIDIFMTTTAVARHSRVVQAFLGAKIHDPKDPAADLGPMFTQVVGTLFRLAHQHEARWRDVHGSKAVPVIGDVTVVDPEAIQVDPARLRAKHDASAPEQRALWKKVITGDMSESMDATAWASIVFDFLNAALADPDRSEELARGLLPLYYLRVAKFVEEAREMTTAQAESIVEAGAVAMEKEKLSEERFIRDERVNERRRGGEATAAERTEPSAKK
jgi:hypothetical protein